MLRHVVFFNFQDGTTENQKRAVQEGLSALPDQIPTIRRYELGPDLGLVEGNFEFALVADFDDQEGYLFYQNHEAHQKVIRETIKPVIAARAAVQYEV